MKSKESAIENVKRLFESSPNEDAISIEQALVSWGRPEGKNDKAWISNKLTGLKYHNLVKPIYRFNEGRRRLDKIQLTFEGKKALGRITDTAFPQEYIAPSEQTLSITDIMAIIAKLKKDNPDFEINFDVKLKGRVS